MKLSKKLFHFLYSLKNSWPFLAGVVILSLVLIALSFIITDGSCDFLKNIFSVLVSLFCGIIVSLATLIIGIYRNSITSYDRILVILSNAIQVIESKYIQKECKSIKEYFDLHFEYTTIYRELCFYSENLTYDKDFDVISKEFKSMVDYLHKINEGSNIITVRKDLEQFVDSIRDKL